MKRIGVLISGGGTNLQALIDKQGTVLKSGKIVCVCSNNSKAYGLERAKNAGIATKVIRKNADCGGDNDEFNRQICAYMKEMDVDVIYGNFYCINACVHCFHIVRRYYVINSVIHTRTGYKRYYSRNQINRNGHTSYVRQNS